MLALVLVLVALPLILLWGVGRLLWALYMTPAKPEVSTGRWVARVLLSPVAFVYLPYFLIRSGMEKEKRKKAERAALKRETAKAARRAAVANAGQQARNRVLATARRSRV